MSRRLEEVLSSAAFDNMATENTITIYQLDVACDDEHTITIITSPDAKVKNVIEDVCVARRRRWEKVGEGWEKVREGWDKVDEGGRRWERGGSRWEKVGRVWEKVGEGWKKVEEGWVKGGIRWMKVGEGERGVGEGM